MTGTSFMFFERNISKLCFFSFFGFQQLERFLHLGHCLFQGPSDMNSLPQTRQVRTLRSRCRFLSISRSARCSLRSFWRWAILPHCSEQNFLRGGTTALLQPSLWHIITKLLLYIAWKFNNAGTPCENQTRYHWVWNPNPYQFMQIAQLDGSARRQGYKRQRHKSLPAGADLHSA